MDPRALPATLRSLATAQPGEHLLVRSIFFESIRDCCASAMLGAGERIVCTDTGARHLTVRTQAGHTVSVSRTCASYVHVEPVDAPRPTIEIKERR
ncbi:MAG TPA: hypothetical protein VMK65_00685 [Longimicrobiales bacterium]|nr:hypothetical protein [Longimicrobiales bacterium]